MCPKCKSESLEIKLKAGIERILIFLTGTRRYRCRKCENTFRAPDRRRTPRPENRPENNKGWIPGSGTPAPEETVAAASSLPSLLELGALADSPIEPTHRPKLRRAISSRARSRGVLVSAYTLRGDRLRQTAHHSAAPTLYAHSRAAGKQRF